MEKKKSKTLVRVAVGLGVCAALVGLAYALIPKCNCFVCNNGR